jgi:glycine cleavage system aminomethyltransferase T
MNILRIEKGHVTGGEINGRTTADDLGFGRMMAAKKPFVGKVLAGRADLTRTDRRQLVGLVPVDGNTPVPRGAQIVVDPAAPTPMQIDGEVTSQCHSPNLGHPIALAIVAGGRERLGEIVHAHSPLTKESVRVRITAPVFLDPEGDRLHG